MNVEIYTDGSARGNPNGPGGYGAVLRYTDPSGTVHERELSGGFKKTTNNRMELTAAIEALKRLNRPCEVDLYSDSQYLVNAFNQHWIDGWKKRGWKKADGEPVENQDLWFILTAQTRKHHVEFIKVKGHADHPQNNRCDELARAAIAEYRRINALPEEGTAAAAGGAAVQPADQEKGPSGKEG